MAYCWVKIHRLVLLLQQREQQINHLLRCDRLTELHNRETFLLEGERLCDRWSNLSNQADTANNLLEPTTHSISRPAHSHYSHYNANHYSANSTDGNRTQNSSLSHSYPHGNKIAVISICLDTLSNIHREFGHRVVDELLQQLARRLQACTAQAAVQGYTTDSTVIGRVSNSEFALVAVPSLAKGTAQLSIEWLIQRLLDAIHQPFLLKSQTLYVEASVGITWRATTTDLSRSLTKASVAASTVQAKSCGQFPYLRPTTASWRDRYAVFHPAMETARTSQQQLMQDLAKATPNQELRVRYQPIVDLTTGKTKGFEALVRWQHPKLGLLKPEIFLPLAEKMGLAVSIDRWVLQHVCRQLCQWRAQHLYPSVSVNFSGSHLAELDLIDNVRATLERYPITPSQLTIEITENVMVSDPQRTISVLEELRQMGLRISLDDFGTGYCSFAYLSQFPVDVVKIDRLFVSGIGTGEIGVSEQVGSFERVREHRDYEESKQTASPRLALELSTTRSRTNEAIVQSILSLADTLGFEVVAEGVEHPSQCSWLRQRKCNYGQGLFFATAITQRSAQSMLSSQFTVQTAC